MKNTIEYLLGEGDNLYDMLLAVEIVDISLNGVDESILEAL